MAVGDQNKETVTYTVILMRPLGWSKLTKEYKKCVAEHLIRIFDSN